MSEPTDDIKPTEYNIVVEYLDPNHKMDMFIVSADHPTIDWLLEDAPSGFIAITSVSSGDHFIALNGIKAIHVAPQAKWMDKEKPKDYNDARRNP